ncbi:glycosyltransferase family 1 protein [Ramaria rubella]|nr:glycosyltransferase family 1 protein [Ramaria rubella]
MCVLPAWGRNIYIHYHFTAAFATYYASAGHLRPLCGLASKIVKERADIAITIFLVGSFGPRFDRELSRHFSERGSEANTKRNIRLVSMGGEGFETLPLIGILFQTFNIHYDKLINGEPIRCAASGEIYHPLSEPNAAIIDYFLFPVLQAIRAKTGKRVPVFAWQSGSASSALQSMAPESFGGFGDISAKARAQAEATGRQFEEIIRSRLLRMYHPAGGKLMSIPGVPTMYDYEMMPQEVRSVYCNLGRCNFDCLPALSFAEECDGFISASLSYEAESLNATRSWLSETNRSLYVVGPLMPPGVGDVGLSYSSKKAEVALSENGDEFDLFLDKMLQCHGERSIIYASHTISFGTMFWPYKDQYVWLFIDVLIELGVPFIFSHARKDVNVPQSVADKMKKYGHGILSKWSPQQTILNHPATGWILTHCGQNSVSEALAQGIPIIAWPIGADQPLIAAQLTLDLDAAFELIEVRTGQGLRPLYRGVTPKGTVEAVAAEARDIIQRARGPEGTRKRKNAETLRANLRADWEDEGTALRDLRRFLSDVCPPQ